jgi:hypothetical protein
MTKTPGGMEYWNDSSVFYFDLDLFSKDLLTAEMGE